ncbi:MAG: cation-transporting P-type ATPase, partial [candidate division WOR-3 bacterium]
MSRWYAQKAEAVLETLGTSRDRGLSSAEAERRLTRYGPNALVERGIKSPLAMIGDQLKSILILLLLVAALISYLLGERLDAGAILAIVVLNAVIGFFQEFRAEKAMAALKRLAVPQVRVR